jgi:hypothetical protein
VLRDDPHGVVQDGGHEPKMVPGRIGTTVHGRVLHPDVVDRVEG